MTSIFLPFLSLIIPLWRFHGASALQRHADHSHGGAAGENAERCVNSFQVWTPNQDVLQKIRRLEERCESVDANIDREVAQMRNTLANEMMEAMNASHRVEKTLLEQRLQDAQHKIDLRDVRIELMAVKADTAKLWSAVASVTPAPAGGVAGSSGPSHPVIATSSSVGDSLLKQDSSLMNQPDASLRERLDNVVGVVNQLKTGVGDLKAEWLMIKREVQSISAESSRLRAGQTSIRDDAAKLKNAIDSVKVESSRLKNQQEELYSLGEKVRNTLKLVRPDYATDLDQNDVTAKLTELSMMTKHLEGELLRMRHENAEIRKELLTSSLTNRNLPTDELNKILDKFSGIQNTSYMTSQQKNTISTPRDCQDVRRNGYDVSGVYQIYPDGGGSVAGTSGRGENVYCEMLQDGSGWTVVSRRVDGSISFVRKWMEYRNGFGSDYGEFWIGNEMLHRLTTQRDYRLRIDIWDFEGGRVYAEYDTFRVDSEANKYKLRVRGYKGNCGDSLSYHDDMSFSAEDADNDLSLRNCADDYKGGWWFNSCATVNLNGIYRIGRYQERETSKADGIIWFTLRENEYYSLKRVEMKIKPA